MPSPHAASLHPFVQSSVFTAFASSHSSPIMGDKKPSPHEDGAQSALHASFEFRLPSSHISEIETYPSPHTQSRPSSFTCPSQSSSMVPTSQFSMPGKTSPTHG